MGFRESEHCFRTDSIKEKMSLTFIAVYQALVDSLRVPLYWRAQQTALTPHLCLE